MTNLVISAAFAAKAKINKFLYNEEGEVNIISTVVLIGIAVTLAIIFRGHIQSLLNSLMTTINTDAANAIK